MVISYKQKCSRCKTNWVEVTNRSRHRICTTCESTQMKGEIKDPAMKKLFNLPEEYYKNPFLRDIKLRYLMFGSLSEKQLAAFKDVVAKTKKNRAAGIISNDTRKAAPKVNKTRMPLIE